MGDQLFHTAQVAYINADQESQQRLSAMEQFDDADLGIIELLETMTEEREGSESALLEAHQKTNPRKRSRSCSRPSADERVTISEQTNRTTSLDRCETGLDSSIAKEALRTLSSPKTLSSQKSSPLTQPAQFKVSKSSPPSKKRVASGQASPDASEVRQSRSTIVVAEKDPKDSAIRVFFSSSTKVDTRNDSTRKMRALDVIKAPSVATCDVFCIRNNASLKVTCNLILAILSGKPVVTENWLSDSLLVGTRHDYHSYFVKAPQREKEWDMKIADAVERARNGRKPLQDYSVFITSVTKKMLGKAFGDMKTIVTAAGSDVTTISKASQIEGNEESVLIIASEGDDLVEVLTELGWRCYSKDMLTMSILREFVDRDSNEFLLGVNDGTVQRPKKRRKTS